MNKCEWKDGKFEGCSAMEIKLGKEIWKWNNYPYDGVTAINADGYVYFFCPFCGADIRKTEPEKPLIVKSGGTWIAHLKGIDYLCIDPVKFERWLKELRSNWIKYPKIKESFIPFPEITLDDEIAKLRPIVYHNYINKGRMTLWGFFKDDQEDYAIVEHLKTVSIYTELSKYIRLATSKELQEVENDNT